MGLGIDLMLLAIDAEPGYLRVGSKLPYALVVAELVDLAVAGRITLRGELIEVLDRSPTGDVLADDSLARLADLGRGLRVEEWLERRGRWHVEAYLAGLRYEHVLRDSSATAIGSGQIEIADSLRAAEPVHRLRALMAAERAPSAVDDVAFMVLADATGWPRAHLRLPTHRHHRARLKRVTASVAAAVDPVGHEGDVALAVLRHGVRAMRTRAQKLGVSGEYGTGPVDSPSGSHGRYDPMNRRGLGLVIDVVAVLALATLVLACLRNVDLAIIISPFCIAMVGVSLTRHVDRRDRLRKTEKPHRDEHQGVSED